MKRNFAALALSVCLAAGLTAQTYTSPFAPFQTALGAFSGTMAGALALNASVGSTWSDAYVGGFPEFGVGAFAGASMTGKGSVDPLFSALGQTVVAPLDSLGLPLPTAGLSAKLGLPFLPIDVGLSGSYIPPSVGAQLRSATGVSVDYLNVAGQIRYAVIQENLLLPDISIGAGVSYQKGSVSAPLGTGDITIINNQQVTPTDYWTIKATSPDLYLGWESTNFDATVQISKSLLILRPYLGAGFTMGLSSVTGGVNSSLSFLDNGSTSDYATLASQMQAYQMTPPTLSATGFTTTATSTTPLFRLYGGLSFELLILKLDAQVLYVPQSGNLGGSLMARLQI